MNASPISQFVLPIRRADPVRLGDRKFHYVDIASIDRETKTITSSSYINASSAPSRARQHLASKDILVSTVRPNLNAVAMVPPHLDGSIGSTGFCILRPDPKRLLPEYLFYFTQTAAFVSGLTRVANGASYPAVTDDDILDANIPVPPIAEQASIARLLSRADHIRRMRDYALQMCRELQLNSFRAKLDNCQKKPMRLGDICLRITDGVHITPTYVIDGVPFLRVTDIQDDPIDWAHVKRITRAEYDEITRRIKPARGDVLYSKNGTIGIAKEITWREPFAHFVSLALLKPNRDRVDSTFLTAWLNTPDALRQAMGHSKTGTVTNLHLNEIEKMIVPLPSIAEQEQLVDFIANCQTLRATCLEAVRQADHLFQTLLHQAFTAGRM